MPNKDLHEPIINNIVDVLKQAKHKTVEVLVDAFLFLKDNPHIEITEALNTSFNTHVK